MPKRPKNVDSRPALTVRDLMRLLVDCDPDGPVFLDGEDDVLRGFIQSGPDLQENMPHGWVRLTR